MRSKDAQKQLARTPLVKCISFPNRLNRAKIPQGELLSSPYHLSFNTTMWYDFAGLGGPGGEGTSGPRVKKCKTVFMVKNVSSVFRILCERFIFGFVIPGNSGSWLSLANR